MKRIFLLLFCVVLLTVKVSANELSDVKDKVNDAIPEDIKEYFEGKDAFSEEEKKRGFDVGFIINAISKAALGVYPDVLRDIASLLALALISSLASALSGALKKGFVKAHTDFITSLCAVLLVYNAVKGIFARTEKSIKALSAFSDAMLPVMTLLYSSGGNIESAALNHSSLMAAIGALEFFTAKLMYPVFSICFALTLVCGFVRSLDISGIAEFVRRTFSTVTALIMTLFCAALSYKNDLAQSADGALIRTVRFAAANTVPIVGGAVSEAARTLGGSLAYIRSSVGFVGISVIFLICVPPFVTLLMYSFGLGIVKSVSKTCGADGIAAFSGEMQGTVGFCMVLLASCASMFIIIFTLLLKTKCVGV